jgi:predicted membrane channel-forming protein YqfA (hemolysin III family)
MVHNETINVWTHFLAALGFVCAIIYILTVEETFNAIISHIDFTSEDKFH